MLQRVQNKMLPNKKYLFISIYLYVSTNAVKDSKKTRK